MMMDRRCGGSRQLLILLSLLVIACISQGCTGKKYAVDTIAKLQIANKEIHEVDQKLQRDLMRRYLNEVKKRIEVSIERKKYMMQVEIYKLTDERMGQVTQSSFDQLDKALEDTVAGLDYQLMEQQNLRKAGRGNIGKELEIAAQLSSTLAVLGEEKKKIALNVRERFMAKRADVLTELDKQFGDLRTDPRIAFDVAEETDKLLEAYSKPRGELAGTIDKGLAQLDRYVQQPRNGAKAFMKALIGESLLKKLDDFADSGLGTALLERSVELFEKGEQVATAKLESVFEKSKNELETRE